MWEAYAAGGAGGVAWSKQYVPSNIAAIVVAAMPLWIALIRWVALRHDRPGRLATIGLLLGFVGIVMLVRSTSGPSAAQGHLAALAMLVFSSLLWASGSLFYRVADLPESPVLAISMRSLVALGYMVTFGSVVGFSSYIWLLKKTDPALASSYAYVNPVVAIILGWLLARESLNAGSLAAAGVILTGVILTVRGTVAPAIQTD